jgi:hypothetical protein
MKKIKHIVIGIFCASIAMVGICAIIPGTVLIWLAITIQEKMED